MIDDKKAEYWLYGWWRCLCPRGLYDAAEEVDHLIKELAKYKKHRIPRRGA